MPTIMDDLERLAAMKQSGLLSDAEFKAAKNNIIAGGSVLPVAASAPTGCTAQDQSEGSCQEVALVAVFQ